MSKPVAIITAGGQYPLRHMAQRIWGINIIRTPRDLDDAPAALAGTFRKIKQVPPGEVQCGCCAKPMHKAKGMAVLRIHPDKDMPTVSMIPLGLCAECLREPDDGKLTPRILKTLTGVDRVFRGWKETLN